MNEKSQEESVETPLFTCPLASPGLEIDYTNYRGERAIRRVNPLLCSVKSTKYHPEVQMILTAVDLDKRVIRDFAVRDIHSWKLANS